MPFKAIETQEELDAIIKDRLNRQKEKYEAKLTDYDQLKTQNEELNARLAESKSALEEAKGKDQTIADLQSKVKGYEQSQLRTKIALQSGLPFDLADRLAGDNEEELKADAERLAGYFAPKEPIAPLKSVEEKPVTGAQAAYRDMLEGLNKGE